MGWTTNELKIEMTSAKIAESTAETIKAFVMKNAVAYSTLIPDVFNNDLKVEENAVVIDISYSIGCEEHFDLIPKLCKAIAEVDPSVVFSGSASALSDCSEETYHKFSFIDGILKVCSEYFPEGDSFFCPNEDCGASIHYEEFPESGIIVCEDCDTECTVDDLIGTLPTLAENIWIIK